MTAHEFMFALDIAGRVPSKDMLTALVSQVLGHVGFTGDATAAIVSAVHAAVVEAGTGASAGCRVVFRARGGSIDVEVSSAEGRIWHTSQAVS